MKRKSNFDHINHCIAVFSMFTLGLLLTSTKSHGDEIAFGVDRPTPREIIDALQPSPKPREALTRSIVIHTTQDTVAGKDEINIDESQPRETLEVSQQFVDDTPSRRELSRTNGNAISLEVKFEFDSARLSEEAKWQLAPLGTALTSDELENVKLLIEGHTDATGPWDYNQQLSERRASAIRTHLISSYYVPSSMLVAVGRGESALLYPEAPAAAANRRVKIVAK